MHPLLAAVQNLEAQRTNVPDFDLELKIKVAQEKLNYELMQGAKRKPQVRRLKAFSQSSIGDSAPGETIKIRPYNMSADVDCDGAAILAMLKD
jgi:hypothetical protein